MGNSISHEEQQEMLMILHQIFSTKYPILDIGERYGQSGYLDFIHPDELTSDIMCGKDMYGRNFIVFKCETVVHSNSLQFFTIFFQRYSNNEYLYHTAGNFGKYLFDTVGGTTLDQMKYLHHLLENKSIELSYNDIIKLKTTYKNSLMSYNINDNSLDKSEIISNVHIGWSIDILHDV
jgi:hypothetical protein